MAHVQTLPDNALNAIAKQVGRLYPSLDSRVTQRQPLAELTETFPVWLLSTDAIDTGSGNLLTLAQDTRRWHSQIWIAGKPESVALSMAPGEDASDWTVKQLLKGDLAIAVDDAIQWVDAEVDTDPLVKILEIPVFSMTVLWLIDGQESSVVIARCPENLQGLSPLAQYSSKDFLEVLRQEPYPIGIRAKPLQLPRQDRENKPKKDTFNVLSIDTNIDGIIPAMVLAEIEEKTGRPTADNFDLIAGTSAGGILALGLSMKDDNGKPQYKASELVDIYQTWRNEFFNPSPQYVWAAGEGLISTAENPLIQGEKWSPNPQNALNAYFHKATLGNVFEKTRTMVTYYDAEANAPFFLKSWEPEHTAVEMWHAAWVTSAAFTHFNPSPLPIGSKVRILVDGGVFINSPVVSAYEEAKRIISEEEIFVDIEESDIFVLALGREAAIGYQNFRSFGNSCVRLYPALDEVGAYMDKPSRDNITNLRGLADKLIRSNKFQEVCNQLTSVV